MKVTLSIFRTIFHHHSTSRHLIYSRKALLSSPSTMRPSSATTATPSTSRFVIFKATLVPPHRKTVPVATRAGAVKLIKKGCSLERCIVNRRPGNGQITRRLIVVRAGHVIAANRTDQLTATGLQPLRANGTVPRRIFGRRGGTRAALQGSRRRSCRLCRLGPDLR